MHRASGALPYAVDNGTRGSIRQTDAVGEFSTAGVIGGEGQVSEEVLGGS